MWRWNWRSFLAACVLTGALLLPHAPAVDVAIGMGIAAGLVTVLKNRGGRAD